VDEDSKVIDPRRALVVTKNEFVSGRDGGALRTGALVAALERSGFEVDWVTAHPFSTSVLRDEHRGRRLSDSLRAGGAALATGSASALKWYSPRAAALIGALCRRRDYDVVVIDHIQLEPYVRLVRAGTIVMSAHNVESELLANYAASSPGVARRLAARHESRRFRRIEARLGSRFDLVVAVSERDAALLREAQTSGSGAAFVVAPNGVRPSFFSASGTREDRVVFVGHLGWRPNVDAAEWLTADVWPEVARERALRLRLVGRSPAPAVRALASETVDVVPDVPDVIPELVTARVATAPLLSAGGTRIKILEALATGTPVVSTSLGALGLERLVGDHLVVADAPDAFAEAVIRLAELDPPRDAVRESVRGFTWEASMASFVEAVQTWPSRR
jgi:glycosyltransferase involved in cell wall biosynthesis